MKDRLSSGKENKRSSDQDSPGPDLKGFIILFGVILPAILLVLYFFARLLFWMLAGASFIALLGVISAILRKDPRIFGSENDDASSDEDTPGRPG